ncbi:BON domain-containing protein [Shinella sp. BYT-45]|uniref:BON domain-containing protein n=1 Tax=Shinella sp. BYT-45 TaxID=3377377 RepID=UPI00398147F7
MTRDFDSGAARAGLRASLKAAIAYDGVCNGHDIDVTLMPGAIILSGRAPAKAARRALQIVREVAGRAPVWDRIIWIPDDG